MSNEKRIAEVLLAENSSALDRTFHYYVPKDTLCGSRVIVPFGVGNRSKEGFVIGFAEESPFASLKEVQEVVDEVPLLTEEMIELAYRMRERCLCTLYQAVRAMIPAGISRKCTQYIILQYNDTDRCGRSQIKKELLRRLSLADGILDRDEVQDIPQKTLREMEAEGLIRLEERITQKIKKKYLRMVSLTEEAEEIDLEALAVKAPKQAQIIDILSQTGSLASGDLVMFSGGSYAALRALEKKGYLYFEERVVQREAYRREQITRTEAPQLTVEQKKAISFLQEKGEGVFLLRGVTGSGKTEVYLQLISALLEQGKEAIILVPEISLTPQTVTRFAGRFGSKISVLHSGLSMGERYDEWLRIRRGEVKVAVGARSAIFAPFTNLGVIVLDEEHEATYKSENAPRYHAREIAVWRGRYHHAQVVLGSATPSVESYYLAQRGDYHLIEMEHRYNLAALPEISIVDMRQELKEGNKSVFSRRLAEEISLNLQRGEQTILFHNRRGYNSVVLCRGCGEVLNCRNCDVPMTFHLHTGELVCHYCGYRCHAPDECPTCGSRAIRYLGTGTQKIEEEIAQLFPGATCLRMDADTTTGRHSHEQILKRFSEERVDILIGTQMVTKGLDFPNVTLVGVLSADVLLHMDDFRANERTFSLLTQVCGRAGRGDISGRAIIQAYTPENSTVQLSRLQDYPKFYHGEIEVRRRLVFPPFCHLVQMVVSGENAEEVKRDIAEAAEHFRKIADPKLYLILGPVPSPYSKIKNRYRYRVLFKCRRFESLLPLFGEVVRQHKEKKKTQLVIDSNPYNFN